MPYKEEDWKQLVHRLETALDFIRQASEDTNKKDLLSFAIFSIWSFGEYAINVVLELQREKPEQHHKQADRAVVLHQNNILKKDYSEKLRQLERYRLKAAHKGYTKNRSVNYTSRDTQNCLDAMLELKAEVEELLKAKGKLS